MKNIANIMIALALALVLSACTPSGDPDDSGFSDDGSDIVDITEHTWFSEQVLSQVGAEGLTQPVGSEILDRPESDYESKIFLAPVSPTTFQVLIINAHDVITNNNATIYELDYAQKTMRQTQLTETILAEDRVSFIYRVQGVPYQLLLEHWPEETYYFPENTVAITFSDMSGEVDDFTWGE